MFLMNIMIHTLLKDVHCMFSPFHMVHIAIQTLKPTNYKLLKPKSLVLLLSMFLKFYYFFSWCKLHSLFALACITFLSSCITCVVAYMQQCNILGFHILFYESQLYTRMSLKSPQNFKFWYFYNSCNPSDHIPLPIFSN